MTDRQRAAVREQVGFENCPIWQFEKDRIAEGEHSLGDEVRMDEANDRAYREDLTGDEYGDTSFLDEVDRQADEAVAELVEMRERGGGVAFTEGDWKR